jgi:Xaa-Pro aminopeptidase
VGMEIHEAPRLAPGSVEMLEPGMIVTVEPGIYLPDFGGVRIEDMVLVTGEGCRVLTQSSKELVEL